MKIKNVNENIIDVFCGIGWGNWTRFITLRKNGKVFFHKIAGQNMSAEDMYSLRRKSQ